jgi:hypothetical protein
MLILLSLCTARGVNTVSHIASTHTLHNDSPNGAPRKKTSSPARVAAPTPRKTFTASGGEYAHSGKNINNEIHVLLRKPLQNLNGEK